MFFALNQFEHHVDCGSQLWVAQELRLLFLTLATIGPEGCGKIKKLSVIMLIGHLEDWMMEPTDCFIGALGLIKSHPRTQNLRILSIVPRQGKFRPAMEWRPGVPVKDPPKLLEYMDEQLVLGEKARQSGLKSAILRILAKRFDVEQLSQPGWTRTAWAKTINLEVDFYAMSKLSLAFIIGNFLKIIFEKPLKHHSDDSTFICCLNTMPYVFMIGMPLLVSWNAWDEDYRIRRQELY